MGCRKIDKCYPYKWKFDKLRGVNKKDNYWGVFRLDEAEAGPGCRVTRKYYNFIGNIFFTKE